MSPWILAKINTVAGVASLFSTYLRVLKSGVLLPHVVFVHRDVVAVDHYKHVLLGGNLPARERQRLNAVHGAPRLCFGETGCSFLHVHIFYDCHGTGASLLRCSWAKKKKKPQKCKCVLMLVCVLVCVCAKEMWEELVRLKVLSAQQLDMRKVLRVGQSSFPFENWTRAKGEESLHMEWNKNSALNLSFPGYVIPGVICCML